MQNNLNAGTASPDICGTLGVTTHPLSVPQSFSVIEDAETKRKRQLLRQRIACDLLLARLFQNHPQHAMTALKGVEPNVVDLEPPEAPKDIVKVTPLPVMRLGEDDPVRVPTISLIVREVSKFYQVPIVEICSRRQMAKVAYPRQIAMYLARMLTLKSLPDIGHQVAGRDHTTASHAFNKIEKLVQTQPRVADEVEVIGLHIRQAMLNERVEA